MIVKKQASEILYITLSIDVSIDKRKMHIDLIQQGNTKTAAYYLSSKIASVTPTCSLLIPRQSVNFAKP